ncbi:glycerophosphoryl diester phosphodiesterase membrane domain-containing protein [Schleiferilactobacillus perolens]|uniref:Glycerophosphoryl diester phosphodiesterase n=1 Tax=Schleiferilactobacillus perolens DSM 12744 TaxID=1423792 RepID=A0A0R1NAB2_9LACO|nr:glycerophosphodiester phosphodiesterase [Schleiferilactobacillus perolens]KRL13883.1 glycerophosphoryl diester phosphodiesterase [Schleiferilactobacillus perolens DSM 12744]
MGLRSIRYTGQALREFFRHWGSYFILSFVVGEAISLIIVPVLHNVTQALLGASGIPYVSYNNLGQIITQHTWGAVALLLLFFLLLLLVYAQFAMILIGVENVVQQRQQNLRAVFGEALRDLRRIRPTTVLFFVFYFILVIPFAGGIINSPLLNKVRIPQFILDFLNENALYGFLIGMFYLAMLYVGIRLIRVLPYMILDDQSAGEAMHNSWQETRKHFWFYFWRITWLTAVVTVVQTLWTEGLILLQSYLDNSQPTFAYVGSIATMATLQVSGLFITALATTLYYLLLVSPDTVIKAAPAPISVKERKKRKRWPRVVAALVIIFAAGIYLVYNAVYMAGGFDYSPITISHRGVDDHNGVQNTIPALQTTAKEKPDYVEMDIHETKDGQWVVMHDENYDALTGVNKTPRQLTLAQATKLTAKENDHAAPVASFDDYLAAAEKLHQKLLVEVKTTPHDSPNAVNDFIKQYGNRLIKDHNRVHSLDYRVIAAIKAQKPKLYASFILPYDLVFPETKADAYTMEYTTLGADFVDQAQDQGKEVWAWTVDNPDTMEEMIFIGADGIITDNLHDLQDTIKSQEDHPSYAARLRVYGNQFNWDSLNGTEN